MDNNPLTSKPADSATNSRLSLRSPIRPAPPDEPLRQPTEPVRERPAADGQAPSDPHQALADLREKMEKVAAEFSQGKLNRAQFNAMYSRYSEQRVIIQRLIERNPESKAWKQVISSSGHTQFLRAHFEAQPLYYAVFRHGAMSPLNVGGKTKPDLEQLSPILSGIWSMPDRPKAGLARKMIAENEWLVVALGEFAVTLVMFLLEPSNEQASLVRDLHADFERANRAALARQTGRLERMVFPQRALVEESY